MCNELQDRVVQGRRSHKKAEAGAMVGSISVRNSDSSAGADAEPGVGSGMMRTAAWSSRGLRLHSFNVSLRKGL